MEYDFFYTGKRQAPRSSQIELHITSTVRDWAGNVFIRKAWYMGHKHDGKKCVEDHVRQHLLDLSAGHMLVMRLMQDFKIGEKHFREWNKYSPDHFRTA